MKLETKLASLGLGTVLAFANSGAEAAKAAPASLQDMWKIIQQQQKEIETLKAKAGENEALKQEVKALKEEQGVAEAAADASAPKQATLKKGKSETERKTDILATEVEKLKSQLFIPDKREYKSEYGFGPAASQVYRVKSGLSIGGYGEAIYTNYVDNKGGLKDTADLYRAVLYAGYKFNDWIILNNEFEFEHGTTGRGGSVSVEFSQLDFMLHKNANIRAGLMLMPMGFINEIHEPTTFHGNYRPDVERFIIPTTWRSIGAGLFGEIVPGLEYRMYAVTGLDARNFTSGGIRSGRQNGGFELAENWAYTGRLDYTPDFAPGMIMGTSVYLGDSGQDQLYNGQKADVFTQLYEGHIQWHYKGLEWRALGAFGDIGDAALVSAQNKRTIGGQNYGWYTEAAYDVMPFVWKDTTQYLAPFFRYEQYNTQGAVPKGFKVDRTWDRWIYQAGLTYKPIPNVAIKADDRTITSAAGGLPNEFNLGLGFIY
ncbi:hypothetical protein ANRL3_01567 [Anaerolineae bacterium]|nr:hypothetical protein ANRL3_01567 [Anaerolineae bacterium]